MKRMNTHLKRLLAVLMILALLSAGVTAFAEASGKKLTVMLYMCGADLEWKYGQISASMGEIMSTRYNTAEVNVIGLLGGSPRWAGNVFDPSVLSIVNISGRRPTKVDEMPLAPMSDPETLVSFLRYCKENYPAEHFILVISDHGGGPLLGCCVDYLFDKSLLSLNALDQALNGSPFAERGLDTIAFDCCLMGSAEIANRLSPYAQYMVATEDSMFGLGYDWLAGVENDASPLETAKKIAESTYRKNKEVIERQESTNLNSVSVIDLNAMPAATAALSDYFATVPELNASSFVKMSRQRRDAVDFGVTESGGNSQYDLADIGSLVETMAQGSTEGNELLKALDAAIPYHFADVKGCVGLTVYHPYVNQVFAQNYINVYAQLDFAPAYTNYVIRYASIMTGTPLANWEKLLIDLPSGQKDNRTLFTLTLTPEQTENLSKARMCVLKKDQDDAYRFSFITNATIDNEKITGEFSGTALYAVNESGETLTGPLPYRLTADGTWLIPAELVYQAEGEEKGEAQQALIICSLDRETKALTPGGVMLWDEALQIWTGNVQAVFTDYSEITLKAQARKETRDENGVLLPYEAWETVSEEAWSSAIDGSWSFRLLNDTLDPETLYACFEVQDSQGSIHSSELHQVKTGASTAAELRTAYDDANLVLINSLSVSAQNQLMLSADLTNLTDTEAIIVLKDLTVNGQALDLTAEAFGTGPNWGLIPQEKQLLALPVPLEQLEGIKTVESIQFNLVLTNAADSAELGTVPVEVTLLLSLPQD